MLKQFLVKNYALIEDLDISLEKGFTVVTGSTGAGKSIFLGALNLVLGGRADIQQLKNKSDNCVLEAVFDVSGLDLGNLFEKTEIEPETELIFRRVIRPNGRSRGFINEMPVNLETLKVFGERLIDIHTQHQNLQLKEKLFQLKLLDSFADQAPLMQEYKTHFKQYKTLQKEFEILTQESEKNKSDQDYYQFQYDALEEAGLETEGLEDIEKELEMLTHAEDIKKTLCEVVAQTTSDKGVLEQLGSMTQKIESLTALYPELQNIAERCSNIEIEAQDILSEIQQKESRVVYDAERIEEINQILGQLYPLYEKYRVSTVTELQEKKEEIAAQLASIQYSDTRLKKVEKDLEIESGQLKSLSTKITQNRKSVLPQIKTKLEEDLQGLGMEAVQIEIQLESELDYKLWGKDSVQLLFSANRGVEPQPLEKVASGGEISRIMLVIKKFISQAETLPTIIFDEIDAGVSGEVAHKMGQLMYEMSQNMQVIAITHLPQVASKGDQHYKVVKQHEANKTQSLMLQLSGAERIKEIAQMLSGEKITEAALKNAESMLE